MGRANAELQHLHQHNAPEAERCLLKSFEMNQLVLYAERLPDSVQRDHVDLG